MRHLNVAQYKTLSLEKIFGQASKYPAVLKVLPDFRDWHRLPRQFVINCTYTQVGNEFSDWVDEQNRERDNKLALEKNLSIQMDPQIFEVWENSTAVSSKYIQA